MSARARWIADRLPGASVAVDADRGDGVRFAGPIEHEFPLDAVEVMIRPDLVAGAVARALAALHAVPTPDCPFDAGTDHLVDLARTHVIAGGVRSEDFSPPYRRLDPSRALEILIDRRDLLGPGPAPVIVHGSLSAADLRFADGRVSALLGLGRAGVGDPYLDLAAAAREVSVRVGGQAVGPFLSTYGVDEPDPIRLDFFALLLELLPPVER